jgi:hypothetical protein
VEEFEIPSSRADLPVRMDFGQLKTSIAMRQVMSERGVDLAYGRSLHDRLLAQGLTEVGSAGRAFLWRQGSAGVELMRANFRQLKDELLKSGLVSEEEFRRDLARLDDPDIAIPSPIMWTAWGRRP